MGAKQNTGKLAGLLILSVCLAAAGVANAATYNVLFKTTGMSNSTIESIIQSSGGTAGITLGDYGYASAVSEDPNFVTNMASNPNVQEVAEDDPSIFEESDVGSASIDLDASTTLAGTPLEIATASVFTNPRLLDCISAPVNDDNSS